MFSLSEPEGSETSDINRLFSTTMSLSTFPCLLALSGPLFRAGRLPLRVPLRNIQNSAQTSFHRSSINPIISEIVKLRRTNLANDESRRFFASAMNTGNGLILRQMSDMESFTYTYLLADEETKEAVIIDPVVEQAERDIKMIKQNGLKLLYAVNTHVHADHITGSGILKRRLLGTQSAISRVSGGKADLYLDHGTCLKFGRHSLEGRLTPGHTGGCMSFVLASAGIAFTGDALLIRGCGRTDFQEGDAGALYESVWREILSLPDSTLLYPAHDYVGLTVTTVGEEKVHNPRLSKSKAEFIGIMNNLNLPYPKQIDKSLPANLVCGLQESLNVQ